MKVGCSVHGAHFPREFEATLKPDCPFWDSMGLTKLPKVHKREIWQWLFMLNTDAIFLKTNFVIRIGISGVKTAKGKKFADIPEYRELTEEEQQKFQKIHLLAKELGI